MASFSYNSEEFEKYLEKQEELYNLNKKINSSLTSQFNTVKEIRELNKNQLHIQGKINKLKEEEEDLKKQLSKINKETNKKEYNAIKKKIKVKEESIKQTQKELKTIKEGTKEIQNQLSLLGSTKIVASKIPSILKYGFNKLKGTGIFEMDKEIRNAVRSMAGGEKVYNNVLNSITKSARSTTMWGVGAKDLAIMQRQYSEEIGRSVLLTEEGYKSMALLAEGTGLGKEYATQLASGMDMFNVSAERTASIVEDNMNNASKLGVNGAAALKSLSKNLKLAQRFKFKGGVKGLSDMSANAVKLRLDMEGIANLSEKVFRPEGAIEMAANLATMGGEFAKLGDPMQLMFKARNDFEGFAMDIGRATKELMEFNDQTGEISQRGGLAADRMREIANITGLSVEKLAEMSEMQIRMDKIRMSVGSGITDDDDIKFIESVAKFNEGMGGFAVSIEGQDKLVKDLRKRDLDLIRDQNRTLEERAKDARTFDETITDLVLSLKQTLLPMAKGLKEGLGDPLIKLTKHWNETGFYKLLEDFGKYAGQLIGTIGGGLVKMMETLGPKGTLGVLLAGKFLSPIIDGAKWFANGVMMRNGFNSGGSLGSTNGLLGKTARNTMKGGGLSGKMGGLGKSMAGKGFGIGAVGALGGLGLNVVRNKMEEPESGGGKALGIASGALSGAGTGAMIGSFIPGVGTAAGAVVGGLIGGGLSAINEFGNPIEINDGIVKFNPQDKFLQVDDSTLIAGTNRGGNQKLAETLSSNNNSNGEVIHKFDDMNLNINVNFGGNESLGNELSKDQTFIRRIKEAIYSEMNMTLSGGKLSPTF